MSIPENTNADAEYDTIRALIYEHGPAEAQRIARQIARAMDALATVFGNVP